MQSVLTLSEAEFRAGRPTPETCRRAASLARAGGALLLRRAFSESLLTRIHDTVTAGGTDWREPASPRDLGPDREHATLRIAPPFNDPAVYANPACLGILRALMGRRLVIGSISLVTTLPGAAAAEVNPEHPPLHGPDEPQEALPAFAFTLLVPLVALGAAHGTMRVWEGSHLADPAEALRGGPSPVETAVGDCLLLDHRTWRADGSAGGAQPRRALSIVYSRPWFRDHLCFPPDHLVSISRDEHARVPDDYKGLFPVASRR